MRDVDKLHERLEILDGARPKNRTRAAVRIEDLAGLLQIETRLQSAKAAGATPTKAEFDALVQDVHAIHRRLVAMMEALQARLL